jgi:LPS-assembly protein
MLLCGASVVACLLAVSAGPAVAQDLGALASDSSAPNGTQMLVEADTLVYDVDKDVVTAVGGVRIEYNGNKLVAQRVSYNRKTSRLVAKGDVQIVEARGTKVFSDEIDITDDFAEGFVNALRVETIDKTYFAAESAERSGGMLTTFNNGVYTACAPCEDKPDRAPIWRIKARKIIWNGQTKTVRFERSRFEFFGFPLATLPAFEIADPTVKRKSGFLFPSVRFNSKLGTGISVPYYFALSPTYDLTVTGSGFTKQGFMGEAEWRQRFDNGEYSLKIAGIRQNNPEKFDPNTVDSGPAGDPNRFRGMIGSRGRFDINPSWQYGWNILAQTDKNFARTYSIDGYTDYIHRSEVYLTGLNDRNFFDLRAMAFNIQEEVLDTSPSSTSRDQPLVLPVLDYARIADEPVAGGELSFKANTRSIYRSELDDITHAPLYGNASRLIQGIDGESTRLTAEAEWKRSMISDGGLVVTPLLALQADSTYVGQSQDSVNAINQFIAVSNPGVAADVRSSYYRLMATAGMELRWPVLFSTSSSMHILEPMAQVFARPDEGQRTRFGIPNEDAQSFVFDASTLFQRDKFSGYDRIEGGTRANVGLRYVGTYDNGWSTNALFGQSYHLAGENSFASPDLVNVGVDSGLQRDRSDFVGLAGFVSPFGLSASLGGRFDEQTFEVRRSEAKMGYNAGPISVSANYAYVSSQPLYGITDARQEVGAAVSFRFLQNWRTFASGTYNLDRSVLVSNSVGLGYEDECFGYTFTMSQSRDPLKLSSDETKFGFNVSLRTLGDFGSGGTGL